MPHQLRLFVSAAIVVASLTTWVAPAPATTPAPPDIGVYGEQPATFRDGVTPFPASGSTWQYQQDSNDPVTRLKFTAVPGLENGLGRFVWRISAFGKYLLLGNGQTLSVGGAATDLRIGVFDSESKQYCDLIIDPQVHAAIPQLVTGNAGARQSRILLAPGTSTGAAAFGYVLADLDSANPCGWTAVMASAAQLNAGFAPADQLCPGNFCAFDTVAMLGHEDVVGDPYGRDYVALGEYFGAHNAVVRIDASGITVVATYKVPLFATPGSGGACYGGGAARLPAANFRLPDTRPANDWRFYFSYDSFLQEVYPPSPPTACAPAYPYCPLDIASDGAHGAPCPGGGTCAQAYCARASAFTGGYVPCTTDANCNFFGNDIGPCLTGCLQKSSLFTCRTTNGGGSHRQCLSVQPSTCPVSGETCSSGQPAIVGPSQEYRFDKTANTITPTSPMFFAANAGRVLIGPSPTGAVYDDDRSVWVGTLNNNQGIYRTKASTDNCTVGSQTTVHVPTGEHCYYDPTNPATAVVVPTDQALAFELTPAIPYLSTTIQVGTAMYVADSGSLQYAQKYYGAWFPVTDTAYKVGFAFAPAYLPITDPLASSSLPAEPQRCSVSLAGCNTDSDCLPNGGSCTTTAENGVSLYNGLKFIEAGGAPRSLWLPSGYAQGPPVAQTDPFLLRVPVGINLTDNLSAVRPSVAWSGDRLWLVAEHNGELKYRIRDDGVWSGWYSLAPNNITTAGGPAVIANANSVGVFARSSSGVVYAKFLTSAESCAAGSCTWGNWGALPGAVTTNDDIAATFAGALPMVAVHGTDDGIYATVGGFGWAPWFRVGALMATNAAPSLTYHVPDGRAWIAARLKSNGALMYSRINPTTFAWDSWSGLPTTGAPTAVVPPAIVSNGATVRLFVPQQAFPNQTWQIANDGSGWSVWRQLISGAGGTYQPAGANINGDVDLVTSWFTNGIQETYIP